MRIDRQGDWLPGVANFGRTPTTGIRDPLLETFIFDFDRNIYGHFIEVALHHYIRAEAHFASVEEMVEQMKADVVQVRALLSD